MTGFHRVDDGLQRAAVVGIAGEHLVAQREAVEGHHQGDADLLAIGPVVAAVAATGQLVALGLALEVGAGHVVQQHLVVDREQLPAAPRQVRLQRGLVLQQQIERSIQPVLVDQIAVELQQVAQRRATVPVLGDVQLARRLAQPSRHQYRRHLRPGHRFLARGHQPLAQIGQPRAAPQGQRQVDVAELARAFDAHALQAHRDRHIGLTVVEQAGLLRRSDQLPRQRPRLQPASRIQLAKLSDCLLDHPTTDTNAAYQPPVAVHLPVLPSRRVTQVHALISTQSRPRENGDGRHYTSFLLLRAR